MNSAPMALRFGIGDPGQLVQESRTLVDGDQLRTGGGDEVGLDLLALPLAQQTVVDEDTGQTIADGALHDGGGDGGVHTAGQAADRASFRTDLLAHSLDELLGDVTGGPGGLQTGDIVQEAGQHLLAVRGMQDLRVVLHTGHLLGGTLEGGDGGTGGARGDIEALGGGGDSVAVAHPHLVGGLEADVERAAVDGDVGTAVLAVAGLRDRAAEGVGHGLEAVADTEDRDAELQQATLQGRGAVGVDRRRATGEDQRRRVLRGDLLGGHRVRDDLGVQPGLTHTTCDELGVLCSEVNDQHGAGSLTGTAGRCAGLLLLGHVAHPTEHRPPSHPGDRPPA